MFNLRRIQSEQDLEKAKTFILDGCAEPNWKSAILLECDGEIVGIGSLQVQTDLFMKEPDAVGYLMLAAHFDGMLRQMGTDSYTFFVPDRFDKHQKFVEKHLPVEWDEMPKGKIYTRSFDK